MQIENYKNLISSLPVRQQSFTTKRTTWKKAEEEFDWLKTLNDKLFAQSSTLSIGRQDIFQTSQVREVIIKTIYWGYTRGMRGNHFVNILRNIPTLEKVLENLKKKANPTTKDFIEFATTIKTITGLGLSTYTKLLYFLGINFNGDPCLILDKRLIDTFASKAYIDFDSLNDIKQHNAENKYLEFLSLINHVSKKLKVKGENIELFLFIFGNNLKQD